jgi:AcrR family transcriptional regulator
VSRRKLISDDAVLVATLRVMSRHGPGGFTLADVAMEAGVAPATLLQRFGAKDRLERLAVARDNQAFAETLAGLPTGRSAASAIAVFLVLTGEAADPQALADQLLWLRLDLGAPEINALVQARFQLLRDAVAARLPPLPMPPQMAARLAEAQWHGALIQWGVERPGRLADYITESLAAWFSLIVDRNQYN